MMSEIGWKSLAEQTLPHILYDFFLAKIQFGQNLPSFPVCFSELFGSYPCVSIISFQLFQSPILAQIFWLFTLLFRDNRAIDHFLMSHLALNHVVRFPMSPMRFKFVRFFSLESLPVFFGRNPAVVFLLFWPRLPHFFHLQFSFRPLF